MQRFFSTTNVCKALDIAPERLREWQVRGLVKPSVASEGQGRKAFFSTPGVYKVALFNHLISAGLKRKEASTFASTFTDTHFVDAGYIIIIYRVHRGKLDVVGVTYGKNDFKGELGNDRLITDAAGEFKELRASKWDGFYLVNFRKIKAIVDAQLAEL